jgi:hypothetical protein
LENQKSTINNSLPTVGGDRGEGGRMLTKYFLSTPTRTLPHREGERVIGEIPIGLDNFYSTADNGETQFKNGEASLP